MDDEYQEGKYMERQEQWLPIAQYAIENNISTSTIRRKIKSNSIEFKLESGRYLIKSDNTPKENTPAPSPDIHSDTIGKPILQTKKRVAIKSSSLEMRDMQEKIEALSKKVEYLAERNAELDMVVRMFEEKLDPLL